VGGFGAVGASGFAGRHLGLTALEVGLSSFEVRLVWIDPRPHNESEPLTAWDFERFGNPGTGGT